MSTAASRVGLVALGVSVSVSCDDPRLARVVRDLWAPFVTVTTEGVSLELSVTRSGDRWLVRGSTPATECARAHLALTEVAARINQHVLTRTDAFATHAAVVAVGRATVAFSAASGTGKSTLTAALVRAGAGYVSDEALCVDRTGGALLPYPRPVALSPWSRSALGLPPRWADEEETLLGVTDLGGRIAEAPGPLTDLVLLDPPDPSGPDLRPVSRQEGLSALLTRSFNHWRDPRTSFGAASGLLVGARVWQLRLGAPIASAELVVASLVGRAPPVG